jgi:predicted outer membrane repeat protein
VLASILAVAPAASSVVRAATNSAVTCAGSVSHDDAAAIQAAVTTATGGGTVTLHGTCYVYTTVTGADVSFVGDGTSGSGTATLIKGAGDDGLGGFRIFALSGAISVSQLSFRDVTAGDAVYLTADATVDVAHVTFEAIAGVGIGGSSGYTQTVSVADGAFTDATTGISSYGPVSLTNTLFTLNRSSGVRADDGILAGTVSAVDSVFTSNGGPATMGSAILANGDVTVSGSMFDHNTYRGAAAIDVNNEGASVTASDSMFTNNVNTDGCDDRYGGAIHSRNAVTIVRSSFTDNTASAYPRFCDGGAGGAISVEATSGSSDSSITDSHFTRNVAAANGGAVNLTTDQTDERPGPNLNVLRSTFDGNGAISLDATYYNSGGGAIWSNYAVVSVTDGSFTGNITSSSGGAICAYDRWVNVADSVFDGNSATTGDGGAIFSGYEFSIARTTFTGNFSTGRYGGGGAIYQSGRFYPYVGPSVISDSTFADNTTGKSGGAVFADGSATLTAWNNTFVRNIAGNGSGGAIRDQGSLAISLWNNTFAENDASTSTGSRVLGMSGSTVRLGNNLFAGTAPSLPTCAIGTLADSGGDIAVTNGSVPSGCVNNLAASREITGGSLLKLQPLADNGVPGDPQTIALGTGSVATDYGVLAVCADPSGVDNVDQRGVARHVSNSADPTSATNYCSSGAYEGTLPTVTPLTVTADSTGGTFGSTPATVGWTASTDGTNVTPNAQIGWAPNAAPTCKAYTSSSDFTAATEVTAGTPAGTYVTHCTGPASATSGDGSTYDVSYTDGTYTVARATPTVGYAGTTAVAVGGTVTPAFSISPTGCTGTATYTLTPNPTTGTGSYQLRTPTDTALNWSTGTYAITVTYAGDANCTGASDGTSLLAVGTATSGAAFGGGYENLSGGTGHFGFQVQSFPKSATSPAYQKGQVQWQQKGQWKFKGILTSYAVSSGVGTARGSGSLWYWQKSGAGGNWVLATASAASVTITFSATTPSTKKSTGSPGTFGISFSGTTVAGAPALPSVPSRTSLNAGTIKMV